MHYRKLILVIFIVSLIHAHYAVRVDTGVETAKKSESVEEPKAEALTLVIHNVPSLPASPGRKLRPMNAMKVIERSDDVVHVFHKNRSKRKSTPRRRRPSNQFRSKIKPSSSGSNFGGFSSNDLRFPQFPSKNFGEPPRASNKFRNPPPSISYDYNSQSRRPPPKRTQPNIAQVYGPPPSLNHIESQFSQPVPFDGKLQTLQQQQSSFPSYSINVVDPVTTNLFGHEVSRFPPVQQNPIGNFPLESGAIFNSQKTSYGEPVRSASQQNNQIGINSYQYNSNLNNRNNVNNINNHNNFPKLPARYEQSDFSTPTRTNPINSDNFSNDFGNFDPSIDIQNAFASSNNKNTRNQNNRFNKFNNYDYDLRNQRNTSPSYENEEEDDEDYSYNFDYAFTTRRPRTTTTTTTVASTTKRSRKGVFGKRKRPIKNHNLDTDDLRDAFTESSNDNFHEIALSSDDFISFDSQRSQRRNKQNQRLHEIHSTLKTAKQNPALRSAIGDDFQIVSIHKSLEKDPNSVDINLNLPFFRRQDDYQEFSVGGEISFDNIPKNHKLT